MKRVFADYRALNPRTPQGYKEFIGAIRHAIESPRRDIASFQKVIKELATFTQFPDLIARRMEQFKVGRGEIDLTWKLLFDEVDLTGTNESSYELTDVKNAVAFKKVPMGEKALVYSLVGANEFITFDQYGAGLSFPQQWYEDQKWWKMEEAIGDYNLAWYEDQATIFFALIEAIADGLFDGTTTGVAAGDGFNIKYQAGTATLDKDIATINAGVISLLNGLKTAGMRVNASTPLVLMCNISRLDRCEAALEQRRNSVYAGPEIVVPSIKLASTLSLTLAAAWSGTAAQATASEMPLCYLAVPGHKSKHIRRVDLSIYPPQFDPQVYATTMFAWGRYGGCINSPQVRRLLASADA